MITQEITLKEILNIENHNAFLEFQCPGTGYLLWPFIRNILIRFIISDIYYKTDVVLIPKKPRSPMAYLVVLRSCIHNFLKPRLRGTILFSATGSHILRNGRFFNRLADDFALAVPDQTVLLERLSSEWDWPFPRYNQRVIFDTPILTIGAITGNFSIRKKHLRIAKEMVAFIAEQTKEVLDWELSYERKVFLVRFLSKKMATLPVKSALFKRLFKSTGARILIRQLSCYGGDSSIMNVIAREQGIVTAEFQHGIVHQGHDAYNFGHLLCESGVYRTTLPEYFLSYGSWWSEQINVPINKITIGNPFRSGVIGKKINAENLTKDILVLGDGLDTELYLELCLKLTQKFKKKMRVVFRPHPLERPRMEQIIKRYANSNIFFEWEKDVYTAFQTAGILVSEKSTVLFEAIGLVERIFVWNTPKARFAFPNHPFGVFSKAEDLIEKIQDGKSGKIYESKAEEFWASNWKQNYFAFLRKVCLN